MIPVQEETEPANFQTNVRTPGRNFLRRVPTPTSKQYNNARYWSAALSDLYNAYNGVCAYCAQWMPLASASVDHYFPKSFNSNLAYEWSNFRLSRDKLNNHKTNSLAIMDPFKIQYDWFTINFINFFIVPHPGLPNYLEAHIQTTIDILQLNTDSDLIQERVRILVDYSNNIYPISFLERRYPFIAYELKRQGLDVNIKSRLRTTPRIP